MLKKVAIIDAGSGNIRSVFSSFEKLNCEAKIITSAPKKDTYDIVVVPGVGSAGYVSKNINKDIKKWIVSRSEENKMVLGVCLGFQLMLDGTNEDGGVEGLSLIPGTCKELSEFEEISLRVGWNSITQNYLTQNKGGSEYYYFNHAYGLNKNDIKNDKDFKFGVIDNSVAWVRSKNIVGVQFHPEKSQNAGSRLLNSLLVNS
jgi:imidazole glycerol-phosphate synthase subunit HisH